MSYLRTKNKSNAPQSAILPATELDRILDEYQAAKREAKEAAIKTAELIRINDERDKMFTVMKESFDILFGEVEELRRDLSERMVLIDKLQAEIKRLRGLKHIKKRLNKHLAVDFQEQL